MERDADLERHTVEGFQPNALLDYALTQHIAPDQHPPVQVKRFELKPLLSYLSRCSA